jgi:alpha-amylase/alpha-mannosidase (GH57 family)
MSIQGFCIHGHFYQPPREDPQTGHIPVEPGALPFLNWNERIHDQCYRPNAALGNFERISFNLGPTLLDWMEGYDPHTVAQIIEQDRYNLQANQVGNAIAQAYNHTILPLAPRPNKVIQVKWGIADFEHHFGHKPAGMWLPETAVDEETLEVLADNGIEFTILAPWQADEPDLDPTQPYWVHLPGGKKIAVFFYDQDLSTRVSFDPGSTSNADAFVANLLMPKFSQEGQGGDPQLVMIASDGELYGHHQPFREKFLAYLLGGAMRGKMIEPTYPGLWLKRFPPKRSVKIRQFSSWSCHHGVTRWMGPCGCTPHGEWKAAQRQAFSEIGGMVDDLSARTVNSSMVRDWEALKHAYIHVILKSVGLRELIDMHAVRRLDQDEYTRIGLLLRAQYEKQRMFTSCGWFFDDYDRIEPKNNTAYGAKAVWLVHKATGIDLSPRAMAWLKPVISWRTGVRADAVFAHYLRKVQSFEEVET